MLICLSGYAQKIINKTIISDYADDKRDIKIYLPEGYDSEEEKNYPLAVILDSELLFDAYVGNSVLFAAKDKAPKQIVVGIEMAKTRKKDTYFNTTTGELTTDNKKFYQFVKDEVIFEIESNYNTSPFISIIGQGTSANLVSFFLGERIPLINSYICINPIFSDFIGPQLQSYNLQRYEKEDNTFYLYINNSTSFSVDKQTKIGELQGGLKSLDIKNLNIINDTINTPSSISAISEAIPRALNQVFQVYSAISKEEFDKNIKDLSPSDAIAYLENKYLEIDFLFGSNLGIRESDIFAIEKIIMEKENGDQLLPFGKMILKLYPSSPLGDYYIGKFYESSKQISKAIVHYKIGYGKMDPADPNADRFYENILRLGGR
ncbi:alpha/beta hydrolase-fold protein [Polaribacter undariae]|uniref:Alpha/beta hydrolase-fold protein n=1 Tax=Polaribacter sejongensis TaxID=985043 RepID=A0AAJ1QW09_9FLAO|nr:alpha/beta hydrolase-fold protein [Polaribacter undariae]MDN3619110.1 alpha/beta hydrolase-fold protein [Polaribacter undariae]UWD33196.1 alpha/beta hydrolase-fold protein [Polaribacter undariae]